ncbi:thioredoxin domain-containing protein [Frigoribacterium sp. 2-23]|uniref:thioredoxin domain-containing protein n=1 Tax=Frigoribacterium sp. 2-23 TaxID=3415006 RepID=UPI003C701B06
MPNRLADAISPYLRSHADNPVDWRDWGAEAFAEAARRDVPVMVSIGYSTCHWCHVMARESFSDPAIAAVLNDGLVAIKVDREEHPDVDASYLAAASAFTEGLGWPLTCFVTPEGRMFFAGTYFPPQPVGDRPSFRQVVDAVLEAWTTRRAEVDQTAGAVAGALRASAEEARRASTPPPTPAEVARSVAGLAPFEDTQFGGFGGAPKFPVAPTQLMLLGQAAAGDETARGLADRTLRRMAASPLRDPVEGGFFRYATRRDWGDPHYERMLYDNALLLQAYSRLAALEAGACGVGAAGAAGAGGVVGPGTLSAESVATGIADFLLTVLRTPRGGFGSAQDSESTIDGRRVEGGYYALDAASRARHERPPVDDKVLTGWNGLAIGALAEAGARQGRPDWVDAAVGAADLLLAEHVRADGRLLRASTASGVSTAVATLEDYGMLAGGLLALATATGRVDYAVAARGLVDDCLAAGAGAGAGAGGGVSHGLAFAVPGGADPLLTEQGVAVTADPSEGAYPSGISSMAAAALLLHQLTGEARYRDAAARALVPATLPALDNPLAFGTTFSLLSALSRESTQLVVVRPVGAPDSDPLSERARRLLGPSTVAVVLDEQEARAFSDAGFSLLEARTCLGGTPTAYLCHDFVCRLPLTDPAALDRALPLSL